MPVGHGTLGALHRDFRGAYFIYLYYLTIRPVVSSIGSVEMWKLPEGNRRLTAEKAEAALKEPETCQMPETTQAI